MESKLTHMFLKEQYERQKHHFHIVSKFVPDVRAVPITPKFYSKCEAIKLKDDDKTRNCYKLIENAIANGPRDIHKEPLLESHVYGWIPGPFLKYDTDIKKLFFRPQVKSDITKVGELITAERISARPQFNGVPFRVVF